MLDITGLDCGGLHCASLLWSCVVPDSIGCQLCWIAFVLDGIDLALCWMAMFLIK
jgi:hypothetical protein